MKVYGPYLRKDGRKHVVLVKDDGTKTSMSYPKYLMLQEGHSFDADDTVDHVDRDYTNNEFGNLQILTRSEHAKQDALRAFEIEIVCVLCGAHAMKKPNVLRHNAKQGKAGPFCGKSCAGKYGKEIQMGEQSLPPQPTVTSQYYKLSKQPRTPIGSRDSA